MQMMLQKQRQRLWTQILDQVEKGLELVKTLIRLLSAWIRVVSICIGVCKYEAGTCTLWG